MPVGCGGTQGKMGPSFEYGRPHVTLAHLNEDPIPPLGPLRLFFPGGVLLLQTGANSVGSGLSQYLEEQWRLLFAGEGVISSLNYTHWCSGMCPANIAQILLSLYRFP